MRNQLVAYLITLLVLCACNSKSIDPKAIEAPTSDLGPAPTVTAISPSSWGVKGGTQVTITGTLFTSKSTVSLGGSACLTVIVDSATQVRCTIPYHPAQAVDVIVTNPDGQTGVLRRGFKYNSFLYVSTQAGASIYGYVIDSGTSAVTSIGSVASPAGAYQMVADPTNTRLYAACASANRVAGYTINSGTGALTAIAGSPFVAGSGANGIAITNDGTRLFASNFSGANITAFTVDTATGALTTVGTYAAGTNPGAMTIDKTGSRLYATNYGSSSISGYSIAGNGALTPLPGSPYSNPGTSAEDGIALHPSGKYIFAGGASNPSTTSVWSVDKTTGALTNIGNYSLGTDNASGGSGVALDQTGTYLYSTSMVTGAVRGFRVSSAGVLTALTPGNQFLAQSGTNYIVLQTLGKLAATANTASNSFTLFQRSTNNGQLSGASSTNIGTSPGTVYLTN